MASVEQYVVPGQPGHLLNPRGRVDGVADDGELDAAAAADGAGHDGAGVDPEADPQPPVVDAVDGLDDLDRRVHGSVGVVGQPLGCAEDGQQPIPHELVGVPAVADDDRHDPLVEAVELSDDLGGRSVLREGREVADVEEHHRDLDLLAAQLGALGGDPRRDARVDVGPERLA